ncbi:HAD family hydrolase [Flagellimonas nanhaiensis]|uniref:HAD family phosphatase n=1 Tax=Flagellimonas nanhaiensis TaxID=2292706 RepID=A0A371JU22_9FLAO|nr:HAD family phosphatase [Allomuricauda nanhaiensis]RDY61310.1 HAD family phosphatase [Allomuricauda nanhaiensis]
MIKNIILDFGDVLINLDKPATARIMERYGFNQVTPEMDFLLKNYEKGLISTSYFIEKTSELFPTASETDLVHAWNAILLDFPEERIQYIENIVSENKYRLFLLSNTNELHIDFVKQQMGMEQYHRFKNLFEVFYLSYEMGMRKPDAEIYEFVLSKNNLAPSETLFVDDTKENTDTAAGIGINVWNLQVGKEDITRLKQYL